MNEKQQQLTFEKGITNVPSDALCADSALEESLGMIYDNNEHRVIQRPVEMMTIDNVPLTTDSTTRKVLYVHSYNNIKRYIVAFDIGDDTHQWVLYWTTNDDESDPTALDSSLIMPIEPKVTSIGKTLVVAGNNSIYYFLWQPQNNNYLALGNKIPEPKIDFTLREVSQIEQSEIGSHCVAIKEMYDGLVFQYKYMEVQEGKQEEYNDLVIGLYSKCKKSAAENKSFCLPFAIRFGLELYDGSYAMLSGPIMMFPAITNNCESLFYDDRLRFHVDAYRIYFKATFDYTEWSDIVKDVVVFASDGVEIYDTTSINQIPDRSKDEVVHDAIRTVVVGRNQKYNSRNGFNDPEEHWRQWAPSIPINRRNKDDILDDLAESSAFYKIFSAGLTGTSGYVDSSTYIKSHVLENLTTQDRIDVDDYFNHCPITGNTVMSYNNRLILADALRGFFDGFDSFLPYDNDYEYTYNIYVYIKTPTGTRIVDKVLKSHEKMGIYFYYPDPRAYKAQIFIAGSSGGFVKKINLKEHPSLHGAYYFGSLPDGTEGEPVISVGDVPTEPTAITTPEPLLNEIYVSEVNNPFIFRAEGNISVGNGRILGLSSQTQALSEGQFGQFPLIIFTTDGIWAASTGATGVFTNVQPMSREICNNVNSITQTDGAVFFTSAKGLMVVVGSNVRCVSEQMSGRKADGESSVGNFSEYLKNCYIAYDCRDSFLWIFRTGYHVSYIYNIKTGTFARFKFADVSTTIDNVVNDYPDYLLQDGKTVYSLMSRHDINDDENHNYTGQIITRPMKLEGALALKSIMQVRHILQFTPYNVTETHEDPETHETVTTTTTQKGTMTLRIFASNNLDNWVELHSLRGTPWKYYRFQYDFKNMKATDRFAGTIVVTQERRSNKLR